MRTIVLGLFFAVAAACASDGSSTTACSQIGCSDGLTVRVSPESAWPAGEYRFTIEADGATTTCTGALPLPACGTSALSCNGTGVSIGESGCALPPAEHAFSDLVFEDNPATVRVEVEHEGVVVGSGSWTPTYQTVQPNGPDCEPTCTNALVELALTFD